MKTFIQKTKDRHGKFHLSRMFGAMLDLIGIHKYKTFGDGEKLICTYCEKTIIL